MRGSEIESVSIGYAGYTHKARDPVRNAISCNLEAGGSTFRTRAYIVVNNTVNVNLADNKAWLAAAIGCPVNSISSLKWGGSDEVMMHLMPVLYENRRFAIAAGGGVGFTISVFPSASVNTTNLKESVEYNFVNVCVVTGLRADVFYGHFFTMHLEYVTTVGNPEVKVQLNDNTSATSIYDCTHFGIGLGYRFAHQKQEDYVPHSW